MRDGSRPGRETQASRTPERVLGRALYLLSASAITLFCLLASVSSWFHGAGIGREHGLYLLRKGDLVIDPGQTVGMLLFVASRALIISVVLLIFVALVLLNQAGCVERLKATLGSEELGLPRAVFYTTVPLVAIPFLLDILAWALGR